MLLLEAVELMYSVNSSAIPLLWYWALFKKRLSCVISTTGWRSFYQNQYYNRVRKQADICLKVNPRPSLQTGLRVDSTTLTVPSVRFTLRCKFQRAVCRKHLDFLGKEITQEILSTLKMSWDALWICQRYSVVILEYVECLWLPVWYLKWVQLLTNTF